MPSEAPYVGQHNLSPYPRGQVLRRWLWELVQATLFRWSPRPCHFWRVGLLRLFGATIPRPGQVRVYPTVRVLHPWELTLEPHTLLGPQVLIYNPARITISYGVNVSQNAHLCSGTHDYTRWAMPLVARPIVIGRNVWITADVFIGPGVTVGELAVIGARSVVLQDQPPRMVCSGHPCGPRKPRPDPL